MFMFSLKTINKNKSNYKGCCLYSMKGFSTLVKTSFANLIVSVITAASKPLITESFCFLRWLYVSTIHLAWRDFKSLNLRDTFTRPGVIPFDNCLLTQSTYQMLNLFEMNLFAAWFTLISTGWNLLIRLWGTRTISQLFFVLSRFISSLPWPL